ncbi:hypothetical protein BGZ60DRAFT_472758 [Tricladium varicosporioides]|nr:hypothetical protein BGZ60DRAFT_472758 [Hymenoscyphus varicosporioides]
MAQSLSFHIHTHQKHLKWNNSLHPILAVSSGQEVTFDLVDGGNNQFTSTSTSADIASFKFDLADPAHGPVYIKEADPGDVLKIEVLSLQTASYGWTSIFPGSVGFGLLADEFPDPYLHIWDLSSTAKDGFTIFKKGIHIPIRPFLGVCGIAREEVGEWSTIPPYETGGNIDCRHATTTGSTLFLPVKVPGALFSCGDGHAAQGDGEVCGAAIETPMKATLRLTVIKSPKMDYIKSPAYITSGPGIRGLKSGEEKEFAVLGIDEDLREACRKAVRGIIAWLVSEKGLTREEAYVLCSVVADLRVAEIVDMPNYGVACSVPLGIFVDE